MKVTETKLEGVLIIDPDVYEDSRGFFKEIWHGARYAAAGMPLKFVQDNISVSGKGVVRGFHYQKTRSQGKLVTVLSGEIFDVAVDIRVGSPAFGHWISEVLSSHNHKQMYVPVGFAHGFMALAEDTKVQYKCTDYFSPETGRGIRFDDPEIGIEWPPLKPVLSETDAGAPKLSEISRELLFEFVCV